MRTYLTKTYPKDDDGLTFSLARPGLLGNLLGRPVRAFVAGLMLLAGLILLAACANLGSLFAARAADRSREIALRLALGSTRRHVLRQLLTEAILVALLGGTLGIAGSVALLRGLSAWQPLSTIPINLPVQPDALTVDAVALFLALLSGLLFGLVPVRQILKADPWQVVKTGSTTGVGGRWVWYTRRAAGGANCVVRCSGHFFAGSSARTGAIATQLISAFSHRVLSWSALTSPWPATMATRCR